MTWGLIWGPQVEPQIRNFHQKMKNDENDENDENLVLVVKVQKRIRKNKFSSKDEKMMKKDENDENLGALKSANFLGLLGADLWGLRWGCFCGLGFWGLIGLTPDGQYSQCQQRHPQQQRQVPLLGSSWQSHQPRSKRQMSRS